MSEAPRTKMVESVVSGFQGSPALLLIVVLNLCAMGAAVYYLVKMDQNRAVTVAQMIDLLQACVTQGKDL